MTTRTQWLAAGLLLTGITGAAAVAHRRQQAVIRTRFEQLNYHIARYNQVTARQVGSSVRQIGYYVCQNHNMVRDQEILRQSQQILLRTQATIDSIRTLRQQLLTATGNHATGALQHPDAAGAVAKWMQNGATKRLQKQLDEYVVFIKAWVPDAGSPTQARPDWKKLVRGSNWFGQFYFGHSSVAAALANLTRFEALLRQYERDALRLQSAKVGSTLVVFDKISVMAVPAAETVAPSTIYRAQLSLSAAAHGMRIRAVRANGQPGTIDEAQGRGLVSFTVPAWQPGQPDTVRAQWQGELVTQGCGRDTTWRLTVPYLIVKPRQHD